VTVPYLDSNRNKLYDLKCPNYYSTPLCLLSVARSSIILETQHEGALQKIQYLEDDSRYKRTRTEEAVIAEKPQFGRPLHNVEHLPEGRSVHLEATLTPVNDPTMKVEWFCNGRPIPQGEYLDNSWNCYLEWENSCSEIDKGIKEIYLVLTFLR
jgi:hypothetical protein